MAYAKIIYVVGMCVLSVIASVSANSARKRGDVASTVFYGLCWLGSIVAIVGA